MSVELKHGAVVINGQPTFIFSGEIQQYRLPAELWQDRLEKCRAAGLNGVGVYFGWNFHAPDRDTVDFTTPDRDLVRFLKLARDAGLYVIARPGPFVCNEWDLGGFPGWLLAEPQGDWRTGDTRHLAWSRRWYRQINAVLAPYQQGRNGPVIIYQVENEHFWGEKALYEGLVEEARANGIEVPLISNAGGSVDRVGAQGLVDGMDLYTDVNELYRWLGWVDVLRRRRQRGAQPLMIMEYRACTVALWGDLPPDEVGLPSEWVATEDRMFLASGANLLNHFVFVGGITPVGYGSDHIATSYGDDAAITPWGELTRKFYLVRRLGLLVESLSEELAESAPWPLPWLTDNPEVECLARRGKRATFFCAVNTTVQAQEYALNLPDGRRLPEEGALPIGPRESQTLVADVTLAADLRLDFCTAQILRLWREGNQVNLIVYGPEGYAGYMDFMVGKGHKRVAFTCTAGVRRVTAAVGNHRVVVYATTPEVAEKTWCAEAEGKVTPLFSNLSLVRPGRDAQGRLRAELPAGEALWLVAPDLKQIIVNDKTIALADRGEGLRELRQMQPKPDKVGFTMSEPEARAEADWMGELGTAKAGWRPVRLFEPKADLIVNPGIYEYQTTFTAQGELPAMLELPGISNAETVVALNGHQLGVWPPKRPAGYPHAFKFFNARFPVAGIVRVGENLLSVACTVIGRHNAGRPIYAGLSHVPVLYRERVEQQLPVWQAAPAEARLWTTDELNERPAPAQPGTDLSAWETVDTRVRRSFPFPDLCEWRYVRWFRTQVKVGPALRGRPLLLECPYWEEVWAYVDGVCVGQTLTGTATTFDLSAYADRKEFTITLALRNQWQRGPWGLTAPPKLVAVDQALRGVWQRRDSSEGRREQWAQATEGWLPAAEIPSARRVWYRWSVGVDQPKGLIAPVYVELEDWVTHAVVYWNGRAIGQWAPVGPDRRFYVSEGLLRKDNVLVVEVDGYAHPAGRGKLRLGTYYRAVPLALGGAF